MQDGDPHAPTPTRPAPGPFVLVLALALGLRVLFAARKGLVLDEFHTWFHASRLVPGGDLAAFLETLARDNHPPLGFLVVAAAKALLGASELALRTPALLFGAVELALVGLLATRLSGRRAGLAALALLGASSLHLDFSSQARMYALHSLCATVVLLSGLALLTRERPRGAGLALGLALTAAFHTHYFGGQYVLAYGLAALALATFDAGARSRLRRLVAPGLVAAVLSAPWALGGFRTQLAHSLPPGGDDFGPGALAEAFAHLFFLNVRLGGSVLRLAFIGGAGLVLTLGALGALRLARERATRTQAALLATGAFGVPLLAFAIAHVAPRAGFTWHYVLPSAAPLAVLAAAGARTGRAPRLAFGLALALAALLSGLNVASHGTERYPDAVAHVLAGHRPGDAVVSVEWQPALFPQGQPWDYYAPRLTAAPPTRVDMLEGEFFVLDRSAFDDAPRVWMLRTSLPDDQHLMRLLRERFDVAETTNFGFGVDVLLWTRR